jgi:precorrin-6B methylase 2
VLAGDRIAIEQVEAWIERLHIGVPGTRLRREDLKKAVEITALLAEVARALPAGRRGRPLVIVDAAAGKASLGLLTAQLLLARGGRTRLVAIERDAARVRACREAARRLDAPAVDVDVVQGDLADTALPADAALVMALHACGSASDHVIEGAVRARSRRLLLVPCCTGKNVRSGHSAERAAKRFGWPRHAAVRRAFIESWVAAERTLRLEAAGYETEVVPFVAPTVTPYNLLWRARRVLEPRRMEAAKASLARLGDVGST